MLKGHLVDGCRPGKLSRGSPFTTLMWSTMSPFSHGAGQCERKPAQYVGKVGATRPCRNRCTEHRVAVTHHFDTGVGDRYNQPAGGKNLRSGVKDGLHRKTTLFGIF